MYQNSFRVDLYLVLSTDGNADNPSHIPLSDQSNDNMDFSERFLNALWYLLHTQHHLFLCKHKLISSQGNITASPLPDFPHLVRNTSLIVVNNHFSLK
jgi:hypothetical protein